MMIKTVELHITEYERDKQHAYIRCTFHVNIHWMVIKIRLIVVILWWKHRVFFLKLQISSRFFWVCDSLHRYYYYQRNVHCGKYSMLLTVAKVRDEMLLVLLVVAVMVENMIYFAMYNHLFHFILFNSILYIVVCSLFIYCCRRLSFYLTGRRTL